MARAYAGAAATHMVFGLLSIAAGVTWMCLLYFYEDLYGKASNTSEKKPIPELLPDWVTVLLSAKIFCGFWFFVTGAVGCAVKSRGCTEGVWVALNVLNVIIWAPVLIFLMVGLALVMLVFTAALEDQSVDMKEFADKFHSMMWLWIFPGIGALAGLVEFILSIVSYSITCCCRPESLADGYEYQYEMK